MNSRKQNQSRKHPIVRFLRGIFRLFKVVFGAKRKQLKSPEDFQHELRVAELERRDREQAIATTEKQISTEKFATVGEVFGKVKWQQPKATVANSIARPLDVSRN